MTKRALAGVLAVAALSLATPAMAADEDYESTRAGHPLRVLAYVVHPVGVILDTLIFRPTSWIFSHEPLKTLVGKED